jgi:hypothetical protein
LPSYFTPVRVTVDVVMLGVSVGVARLIPASATVEVVMLGVRVGLAMPVPVSVTGGVVIAGGKTGGLAAPLVASSTKSAKT